MVFWANVQAFLFSPHDIFSHLLPVCGVWELSSTSQNDWWVSTHWTPLASLLKLSHTEMSPEIFGSDYCVPFTLTGFSRVTHFDKWFISKHYTRWGLKSMCVLGLILCSDGIRLQNSGRHRQLTVHLRQPRLENSVTSTVWMIPGMSTENHSPRSCPGADNVLAAVLNHGALECYAEVGNWHRRSENINNSGS